MVVVILNPIAGGARAEVIARRRAAIAEVLAGHAEPTALWVTGGHGEAEHLARRAAAEGARLVIACGGDGTVNEVGRGLVRTETVLGIAAAGSGNGLARSLALPSDPVAAVRHALRAQNRRIDAGTLNGRWFFCTAGVGFDAAIAAAFAADTAGTRGLRTYARLVVQGFRTFETFEAEVDGRACHRVFMLTWANAPQFGAGAKVAPSARMDDGRLECVVFEESSRLAMVLAVPALFAGYAAQIPGVQVTSRASSVVESPTPLRGHVDGEPFGVGRRADALAHPGVLRVVAR